MLDRSRWHMGHGAKPIVHLNLVVDIVKHRFCFRTERISSFHEALAVVIRKSCLSAELLEEWYAWNSSVIDNPSLGAPTRTFITSKWHFCLEASSSCEIIGEITGEVTGEIIGTSAVGRGAMGRRPLTFGTF